MVEKGVSKNMEILRIFFSKFNLSVPVNMPKGRGKIHSSQVYLGTYFRSDWKYMSISDVPTMEMEDDYLERMDFWSYVVSQLD